MNNRRQSREIAFALLFEWSFKPEEALENIIESATEFREMKIDAFAENLATQAVVNISTVDQTIEQYLHDWKLTRLSKVCLACLRMAVSELLYCEDIPIAVTANEAVEIAKKYGSEDEPAFINGIIGKLGANTEKNNS